MRCSLAFLLLVSSTASAQAFNSNLLMDACMKEKNLELCRDLSAARDNSEKIGARFLKSWGIVNIVAVLGTLYKVGTEKKITFVDKTNTVYLPGNERHFELTKDSIMLVFLWPLPW